MKSSLLVLALVPALSMSAVPLTLPMPTTLQAVVVTTTDLTHTAEGDAMPTLWRITGATLPDKTPFAGLNGCFIRAMISSERVDEYRTAQVKTEALVCEGQGESKEIKLDELAVFPDHIRRQLFVKPGEPLVIPANTPVGIILSKDLVLN